LKKYFLILFYSFLHNGKNRKEILVRSLFFITILYIFSKLWQATQFSSASNPQTMIWYLSVTELIVLSIPLIQVDIENDIRSGDIIYQLLKPINYLGLKIFECIGAFLFRFIVLTLISIPFCTFLSGYTPPLSLLCSVYLIAGVSGLVFILFHMTIGLLAFKLQDSSPLFWVWQRCSFLLGGLVIPLDFYPTFLRKIAFFSPFASLLYAPARLIIELNVEKVLFVLAGLLFWGSIALFLASWLYSRMLKSLKVNGG
jgi:ABC-2 type transport system permease protein